MLAASTKPLPSASCRQPRPCHSRGSEGPIPSSSTPGPGDQRSSIFVSKWYLDGNGMSGVDKVFGLSLPARMQSIKGDCSACAVCERGSNAVLYFMESSESSAWQGDEIALVEEVVHRVVRPLLHRLSEEGEHAFPVRGRSSTPLGWAERGLHVDRCRPVHRRRLQRRRRRQPERHRPPHRGYTTARYEELPWMYRTSTPARYSDAALPSIPVQVSKEPAHYIQLDTYRTPRATSGPISASTIESSFRFLRLACVCGTHARSPPPLLRQLPAAAPARALRGSEDSGRAVTGTPTVPHHTPVVTYRVPRSTACQLHSL
eukprot:6177115-Pleurochrysis_carterae.AAC.2